MSAPPLSAEHVERGAARFKGSAAARLAPQPRFGGPMPWMLAILIALVFVAVAGGLALRNMAMNARADLSGAVTVQIVEAEPERRSELANEAALILRNDAGVSNVSVVPEAELSEMLEPWIGEAGNDIPIPALIDVQLTNDAGPKEVERLQKLLDRNVGAARVDAQSRWLQPVYSALSALQYLAVGLSVLIAFACAAAVWLSARNSLANHKDTIEIIHLLGGTDRQVTRIFLRSVIIDAAFGGAVGFLLGSATVFLIGQQFALLDSGMTAGGGLTAIDLVVLSSIPFIALALAIITGRLTITSALKRML